jgi:predicted MarR family transcription regulator
MQQTLNLQIDDIWILVDIRNLEDVLLAPRRLDAKILVTLTGQGLELTLESEKVGGNAPNRLVPERRRIAV